MNQSNSITVVAYGGDGEALARLSIPVDPGADFELSAEAFVEGQPAWDLIRRRWDALADHLKATIEDEYPAGYPVGDGRTVSLKKIYGAKACNRESILRLAPELAKREVDQTAFRQASEGRGPLAKALAQFREVVSRALVIDGAAPLDTSAGVIRQQGILGG